MVCAGAPRATASCFAAVTIDCRSLGMAWGSGLTTGGASATPLAHPASHIAARQTIAGIVGFDIFHLSPGCLPRGVSLRQKLFRRRCDRAFGAKLLGAELAYDARERQLIAIHLPRRSAALAGRANAMSIARRPKKRIFMKPPSYMFSESGDASGPVSYTHLRAHETPEHLVC